MPRLTTMARNPAAITAIVVLALATSCAPSTSSAHETEGDATPRAAQRQSTDTEHTAPDSGQPNPNVTDDNSIDDQDNTMTAITIEINGATFTAHLEDNATAKAFANLLPTTLTMDELNGNEKYHYLDSSLPSEPQRVGTIHAGDIMLYGSDCIVLFYQTFRTPYSYTRIGSIADPERLANALGAGAASVTFTTEQAA